MYTSRGFQRLSSLSPLILLNPSWACDWRCNLNLPALDRRPNISIRPSFHFRYMRFVIIKTQYRMYIDIVPWVAVLFHPKIEFKSWYAIGQSSLFIMSIKYVPPLVEALPGYIISFWAIDEDDDGELTSGLPHVKCHIFPCTLKLPGPSPVSATSPPTALENE